MSRPSVFLPPELVHNIIDFLADDRQTHYNAALASRFFLHPSRKYIFGNVLLRSSSGNNRPARRLLNFVSICQHLIPYITSLRVMIGHFLSVRVFGEEMKCGWVHEDNALPVVFATLKQLQGISIEATNHLLRWRTVPLDLQKAVMDVLGRPVFRRLSLVLVEDFPIQSLRNSPNLRNIILHCATFTEDVHTSGELCSNTRTRTSSTLESLQIVTSRDAKLFDVHTRFQISEAMALDLAQLKRLSLSIFGRSMSYSEDISIVARLLNLCSPSLELLKLTPPLMFASRSDLANNPFHLASIPKLRRLEFGLEISDFDEMETSISLLWLTKIFSNLPPCNVIEDIVLKCKILQANPLGEFVHKIWTKIDKILTCKELAYLRRVTLILYPVCSEAKRRSSVATEVLEQEICILRKGNILHIEKRYGESVKALHNLK